MKPSIQVYRLSNIVLKLFIGLILSGLFSDAKLQKNLLRGHHLFSLFHLTLQNSVSNQSIVHNEMTKCAKHYLYFTLIIHQIAQYYPPMGQSYI